MESERILPKKERHTPAQLRYLTTGSRAEKYHLALESAEEENRKLREEIERAKVLVEKAWIDGFDKGEGYQNNPLLIDELFNQFKEENNIG